MLQLLDKAVQKLAKGFEKTFLPQDNSKAEFLSVPISKPLEPFSFEDYKYDVIDAMGFLILENANNSTILKATLLDLDKIDLSPGKVNIIKRPVVQQPTFEQVAPTQWYLRDKLKEDLFHFKGEYPMEVFYPPKVFDYQSLVDYQSYAAKMMEKAQYSLAQSPYGGIFSQCPCGCNANFAVQQRELETKINTEKQLAAPPEIDLDRVLSMPLRAGQLIDTMDHGCAWGAVAAGVFGMDELRRLTAEYGSTFGVRAIAARLGVKPDFAMRIAALNDYGQMEQARRLLVQHLIENGKVVPKVDPKFDFSRIRG